MEQSCLLYSFLGARGAETGLKGGGKIVVQKRDNRVAPSNSGKIREGGLRGPKEPLLRSSGILSSGILEQRGKGNISQRGQGEISRRVLAGSNKEHEQQLDTPGAEARCWIYMLFFFSFMIALPSALV